MSRLPQETIDAAETVDAAKPREGGGLWPIGRYICTLAAYSDEKGTASGIGYWKLQFAPVKKYDQGVFGRVFDQISWDVKSAPFAKALFSGFGYKTNSDIKELVDGGETGDAYAWVYVGQRTKQEKDPTTGKYVNVKTGEKVNVVQGYGRIEKGDELPPLAE